MSPKRDALFLPNSMIGNYDRLKSNITIVCDSQTSGAGLPPEWRYMIREKLRG
jgi:hypothetical protein